MAQPTSCREINLNNCKDGESVSGNCYWKTSTCVEKQCENLGLNTHDQCHNVLSTCTVAQDLQNCMKLATECSSYKKQEKYKFTSDKSLCSWRIDKCVNIQFSDADNYESYNTNLKCSEFLTKTDKCIVVESEKFRVH
ncbi:unnamed protein product [Paramecium octaurelia]|uniref:Uncharacterized protein n=1 Tax=Paramecium octaurelia TaxID=43137 RepID=A0A8S1URA4_PAROT|nr:unnamed protein product [Paramecium octaurelia]